MQLDVTLPDGSMKTFRISEVKITKSTSERGDQKIFHIDRLPDNKYRMTFSTYTFGDTINNMNFEIKP